MLKQLCIIKDNKADSLDYYAIFDISFAEIKIHYFFILDLYQGDSFVKDLGTIISDEIL